MTSKRPVSAGDATSNSMSDFPDERSFGVTHELARFENNRKIL